MEKIEQQEGKAALLRGQEGLDSGDAGEVDFDLKTGSSRALPVASVASKVRFTRRAKTFDICSIARNAAAADRVYDPLSFHGSSSEGS